MLFFLNGTSCNFCLHRIPEDTFSLLDRTPPALVGVRANYQGCTPINNSICPSQSFTLDFWNLVGAFKYPPVIKHGCKIPYPLEMDVFP
jgi:hypothetical protein